MLNRRMPNGTYGGVRGGLNSPYSIKYSQSIKRLINGLNEFKDQKDTYENPEAYLEMFLSSVAKEINLQIENERKLKNKCK